jgi:hypothetical protein
MDAQEAKKWLDAKYGNDSSPFIEDDDLINAVAQDLTEFAAAHSAQVEAELQDVKGQLSTAIGNWKLALDERAAAEAELVKLQTRLRREWWNNHGCKDFRYGDDGEMQCSGCGGDFLRQPFDELEAHVKKTRWDALCRAGAKLVAEGKDFGSLSGEALGETGPEEK